MSHAAILQAAGPPLTSATDPPWDLALLVLILPDICILGLWGSRVQTLAHARAWAMSWPVLRSGYADGRPRPIVEIFFSTGPSMARAGRWTAHWFGPEG